MFKFFELLLAFLRGIIFKIKKGKIFTPAIILLYPGSNIYIDDSVKLRFAYIVVSSNSSFLISNNAILGSRNLIKANYIFVKEGKMIVQNHTRINCNVEINWGGILEIGSFTTINHNTYIRCDEHISIGSFNDISYNCLITDSNFHNFEINIMNKINNKISSYPFFTVDDHKPITKAVYISDCCWIGINSWLFKGTNIENSSLVAAGTKIFNKKYPAYSMIGGFPSKLIKSLKEKN